MLTGRKHASGGTHASRGPRVWDPWFKASTDKNVSIIKADLTKCEQQQYPNVVDLSLGRTSALWTRSSRNHQNSGFVKPTIHLIRKSPFPGIQTSPKIGN